MLWRLYCHPWKRPVWIRNQVEPVLNCQAMSKLSLDKLSVLMGPMNARKLHDATCVKLDTLLDCYHL